MFQFLFLHQQLRGRGPGLDQQAGDLVRMFDRRWSD